GGGHRARRGDPHRRKRRSRHPDRLDADERSQHRPRLRSEPDAEAALPHRRRDHRKTRLLVEDVDEEPRREGVRLQSRAQRPAADALRRSARLQRRLEPARVPPPRHRPARDRKGVLGEPRMTPDTLITDEMRTAWEEAMPDGLAANNLGLLAAQDGALDRARQLLAQAVELRPAAGPAW